MMLSIIIPVFNERQSLPAILCAVTKTLPGVEKEILLIDDGSTDGTSQWLAVNAETAQECAGLVLDGAGNLVALPGVGVRLRTFTHAVNRGKGAALRTGLASVTGDVVVIQDADLEYEPEDWTGMWRLIAEKAVADVVFGSRFYGNPHRSLYFHHYIANRLISLSFNLLFNQTLSDVECCYKMFSRQVCDSLVLHCDDFGCEIEISAKIARARNWRIYEMGVSYYGRTYAEGKKITWRDGVKAFWYLLRFRLQP